MFFSTKTVAVVASMFSGALAQTYSACNPLTNGTECGQNIKAFGGTYTWDYTKGECPEFTATGSANRINYTSEGMVMSVAGRKDSPTLQSNKAFLWGKVEVVMKAAPGQGVISSIVFQSDVLDEIDYEWIGSKGAEVQSNYFGKGDTSSYDRGGVHANAGATQEFHKYTVDWTKDAITWYIDDKVQRVVKPSDVNGTWTRYPQTPMYCKIGPWDAGYKGNAPGTVQWAGGNTQYAQGPFNMVVKSVSITDYTKGAKTYSYGDNTGSWESIKVGYKAVKDDDKDDNKENSSTASASAATTLATSYPTGSAVPISNGTATPTESGAYSIPSGTSSAVPTAPSPQGNGAGALKAVSSVFALVVAAAAALL